MKHHLKCIPNGSLTSRNSCFTSEIWKSDKNKKMMIIIVNNLFWDLDINFSHCSPKKGQKNIFQDSNFGLADNKNAIETLLNVILSLRKRYGRHCHRYLGKVKFLGSIGSQKGAKTQFFFRGVRIYPLPFVGLKSCIVDLSWSHNLALKFFILTNESAWKM